MQKLFLFLLGLGPLLGVAQLIDSSSTGYVTLNDQTVHHFDTVFNISDYLSFTDYGFDGFGVISMGNQGDVRRRLSTPYLYSMEPNLGIDGYFKNFSLAQDVRFYNVKVPTGGIRFLTGYLKGQMFGAFLTINPISRLNTFVDYQRINSRGNYFNQQSVTDQLKISTSYSTKTNSYSFAAALSWNKAVNLEYGGIANLDDFQDNRLDNRELIPVNLNASGNRIRQTSVTINQSFKLAKISSKADIRGFYDLGYLDQYVAFQSSDSAFVYDAIFESGTVKDSVRLGQVKNFAGLEYKGENHVARGGITYSHYTFGNAFFKQAENLIGLKVALNGTLGIFAYKGNWENYFNDSYAGSYQLNFGISTKLFNNQATFFANLNHGLVNPGLFTQKYISNVFVWDNDFSKILCTKVSGGLSYKAFSVEAGTQLINNHVYFNSLANPAQYNGLISNFYGEAQANFKLVGGLRLDNRARYQGTSNADIIRIPDWVLRHILYYEFESFNRMLAMHVGVEFQYFSSFTSENYMPATTVMFLQDELTIGNFPYFNAFVNFKIQEFSFFLRLENVTQGLFEYNYYAAPRYPLPDFSIRFGASWRFFN